MGTTRVTLHRRPFLSDAEALAARAQGATRVDLREPAARAASGVTVAGTAIRDPLSFGHADPLTRAAGPILAFCVRGREVSRVACALLLVHGREARYVAGGFGALVAAGATLAPIA